MRLPGNLGFFKQSPFRNFLSTPKFKNPKTNRL